MSFDPGQCHGGVNFRKSHLTKEERSPKLFRDVARVLQDVKSKKANIKTALYSANIRRYVFDKVYAVTCSVLKHLKVIDKVIEDVELLVKEPRLNLELAEILIHEICVSQKPLKGSSKPVLIVQKYQKDIEESFAKQFSDFSRQLSSKEEENYVPRYARVNTLVTDVSQVSSVLRKKNFYEIVYDDKITLDQYHEKVKQLQPYEFLIDIHFKDLLVFPRSQNLCHLQLYQNGHIFLQDKSSYIPVHVLSPQPGSIAFDTCAAPGMKTVHIAACMNNSGKIFATDCDEKRFAVLKETLKSGQVEICKSSCCNFTDIDPHDEQFSSVEYILVDPSCSGSGMVNRMDHVTDDEQSKSEDRLRKLAGFQLVLLKHALSFPSVKRVVYSTCSVSEIENEYVVHEALGHYQHLFQLVPALPEWETRGQGEYEFSHLCLRSFPESNLTNGFFVAAFERLQGVQGVKMNSRVGNCENVSSEVTDGQKIAGSVFVDNKMLSRSEETKITCKMEDSVNSTSCKNVSKKHKRKHKSDEIHTVSDSLEGIDHHMFEDSGSNPEKSGCAESMDKLTESAVVQKHKKRKHKDYKYNKINPDFQEFVTSIDKLCDMKDNSGESMAVKKHKKKKNRDLNQNPSNCDMHHAVGTSPDELRSARENVEEYDETTVVKKHKRKKHKHAEHSHSNATENMEGKVEITAVKRHKKKHSDTGENSSNCNLHLTSGDVKESIGEYVETAMVKRHKKKKHRDTEENSSNTNFHLEHGDEKENVGGCLQTNDVKKHKKKHRDVEQNSANCNLHLKNDVEENTAEDVETVGVKKHKKKKKNIV